MEAVTEQARWAPGAPPIAGSPEQNLVGIVRDGGRHLVHVAGTRVRCDRWLPVVVSGRSPNGFCVEGRREGRSGVRKQRDHASNGGSKRERANGWSQHLGLLRHAVAPQTPTGSRDLPSSSFVEWA